MQANRKGGHRNQNIVLEVRIAANVQNREGYMGTTADKIAKVIMAQERSGVIDLSSYRATKATLKEARLDQDRLRELLDKGYDPAHAVFVYVQNCVSVLAENMSALKELRQFARIVAKAEDDYMPSYPPMSPITKSYFTMWAFFDVLFGQRHETIGTCIQRVGENMEFPDFFSEALVAMQNSRMGFYMHCGIEDKYVILREFGTDDIKRCYSSSGYKGKKGQIWFVRLVPPSMGLVTYDVIMTTPYVLVGTTEGMIGTYLAREMVRLGSRRLPHGLDAYSFIMKHGPTPNHWNEYIFCAYSNYKSDVVFISGIPDMKETLPCAS